MRKEQEKLKIKNFKNKRLRKETKKKIQSFGPEYREPTIEFCHLE